MSNLMKIRPVGAELFHADTTKNRRQLSSRDTSVFWFRPTTKESNTKQTQII